MWETLHGPQDRTVHLVGWSSYATLIWCLAMCTCGVGTSGRCFQVTRWQKTQENFKSNTCFSSGRCFGPPPSCHQNSTCTEAFSSDEARTGATLSCSCQVKGLGSSSDASRTLEGTTLVETWHTAAACLAASEYRLDGLCYWFSSYLSIHENIWFPNFIWFT